MTPSLLREAGEALFGSTWQSDLARALGVAIRTVQRWAAGTSAIPSRVPDEIRALGDSRVAGWREVRARLPRNEKSPPAG